MATNGNIWFIQVFESSDNTNVDKSEGASSKSVIDDNRNIINDRVLISPDKSIINSVYENIEHDDIPLDINNEWITNNNKYRKRNTFLNHDNTNFVHHNRFENLNNTNTEPITNIDEEENNGNIIRNQHDYARRPENRSRPSVVTQDYPENNCLKIPIKPGINNYNQAVKDGRTTVMFSTSITTGINVRDFNNRYKIGTARFRRFPSAKAKYVKHYIIPTLIDENPQVVILQCGGNDLRCEHQRIILHQSKISQNI